MAIATQNSSAFPEPPELPEPAAGASTSTVLSLRLAPAALASIEDLAVRIAERRPVQGKPSRTEVVLMGLDALRRELAGVGEAPCP
jgi:hypothetical protein